MCQKDFILDLKIYRHLSESYVLAYLQSKLLFFVGTINSLASTSRHSAIFTNVSNPGCAVWYTILKLLCSLFQECLPAICLSFSVPPGPL